MLALLHSQSKVSCQVSLAMVLLQTCTHRMPACAFGALQTLLTMSNWEETTALSGLDRFLGWLYLQHSSDHNFNRQKHPGQSDRKQGESFEMRFGNKVADKCSGIMPAERSMLSETWLVNSVWGKKVQTHHLLEPITGLNLKILTYFQDKYATKSMTCLIRCVY